MANFEKFIPHILKWEGLYGDYTWDPGGCTMRGITLATWKEYGGRNRDKNSDGIVDCEDVKLITKEDAISVYKPIFWLRLKADKIKNQEIAEMISDWFITSGWYAVNGTQKVLASLGAKNIQISSQVFSLSDADIKAINSLPQQKLYDALKQQRLQFYRNINNPTAIQGWTNRVNDFPLKVYSSINTKIYITLAIIAILAVLVYFYRKEILEFYKTQFQKIKGNVS
jgi:lysozyme family protein